MFSSVTTPSASDATSTSRRRYSADSCVTYACDATDVAAADDAPSWAKVLRAIAAKASCTVSDYKIKCIFNFSLARVNVTDT